MSLMYMVVEMIKERGCGTVDHLEPELSKHGYTRAQIISALHNARSAGRLWSDAKPSQKGIPRGAKKPSVYWPGTKPPPMFAQLVKRDKPEEALIASAWDWGTPKSKSALTHEWQGTVYQPGGPWNSAEEAQEETA